MMPSSPAGDLPTRASSTPWIVATTSSGLEQAEINGLSHRQVPGPVRVQLVAGTAGGALGHELGLEPAALRIERRGIEVDDTVEQLRSPNEIVQRAALLILFGGSVRGVAAAERADDGGAVDLQARLLLAEIGHAP